MLFQEGLGAFDRVKFSPASEGGAEGLGSGPSAERVVSNLRDISPDIGEPDLVILKKNELTRFREITAQEDAAGGYKDKYDKVGSSETHLVSQRAKLDGEGNITEWEDRSPILRTEFEKKYEAHPEIDGVYLAKAPTTVLILREGESISFHNSNENYDGSIQYGDGNALAFDSQGIPYAFPLKKNTDNGAFSVAGTVTRAEFLDSISPGN